MDSYGLSETLNQQENLTNEDQAKNQFLQESFNDAMTKYNLKTRNNQIDYKDEGDEEEERALTGFGTELTDAGVKAKGLRDAVQEGYKGFDNLSQAAQKIKSGVQSGVQSVKTAFSSTPAPAPEDMAEQARVNATQSEAIQGGQNEGAGQAGETEAGSGEGTGAADTGTAGNTAGATGEAAEGGEAAEEVAGAAEEGSSTLGKVAGVVGEGVGRAAAGAVGVGNLGYDIYKQVQGGGFMKGGVNTGDDIGNITNEAGSAIDILGAATGDPLLMAAGVGVGLIGSAISGISELFHHHEDKPKPPPPPKQSSAPVAVQSLAAEGDIGQAASQSSLAAVQVGAS